MSPSVRNWSWRDTEGGGGVGIVESWLHWQGQLPQLEEVRSEAIYPHPHYLPFLIFPDVITEMLVRKEFHHSSPLLHRIATIKP